jgi:hypothetical protein
MREARRRQRTPQVAVAGISGAVFVVTPWGDCEQLMDVGQCVTVLAAVPVPHPAEPHVLLCGGHFDGVRVYHAGVRVAEVIVDDWVHSIACCEGAVSTAPSGHSKLADGWMPTAVLGVSGDRLVAVGAA